MNRHEALSRTILQCEIGSSASGLQLDDTGDRDEMGILIERLSDAMPVSGQPFEQFIYRSAAERDGRSDAPSQAGDLDLVVYSLRKWLHLTLQGNPTVLFMLFAPITFVNATGASLRGLAPAFASQKAGKRFSGYLRGQRERLLGQRGQKDVNRPELVEKYGFDTKHCMHMLRLGIQGCEFLETGRIQLPMREPIKSQLVDVRRGKYSEADCIEWSKSLENDLEQLIHGKSPLPQQPDYQRVQRWADDTYLQAWINDRGKADYDEITRQLAMYPSVDKNGSYVVE